MNGKRSTSLAALAATLAALVVAGADAESAPPPAAATSAAAASRDGRPPPAKPKPAKFTLSVSGDLLMHEPLNDRALANGGGDEYDYAPFFNRIAPYVAAADVAFCHLETPLASGAPSGYPIFQTPPDLAASLAKSGWDACDHASNHSLDQGARGIATTTKALDRAGLANTGSFPSQRRGREPTLVRVRRGLKLGLVAYTDSTNGLPPPAPWAVNLYDSANLDKAEHKIIHDAKRARRAGADGVVVNLHWGAENDGSPTAAQRALAKRLTRSDAIAAIVGQGPHVVQPIARMHGKFVVFSEGNLVSNQSPAAGLPAATQDGLIAMLRFVARGEEVRAVGLSYVPVWVRPGDYVVLPALAGVDGSNGAALARSYRRTVAVAGHGHGFGPVPRR